MGSTRRPPPRLINADLVWQWHPPHVAVTNGLYIGSEAAALEAAARGDFDVVALLSAAPPQGADWTTVETSWSAASSAGEVKSSQSASPLGEPAASPRHEPRAASSSLHFSTSSPALDPPADRRSVAATSSSPTTSSVSSAMRRMFSSPRARSSSSAPRTTAATPQRCFHVPVRDAASEDLLTWLAPVISFIRDSMHPERREQRHVLVHCQLGVSRSAAVVAAYLIQEMNMSFRQAVAHLETVRPRVRINGGFKDQLATFEARNRGEAPAFNAQELLVRATAASYRPRLDFPAAEQRDAVVRFNPVSFTSDEVDLAAQNILRVYFAWGGSDLERKKLRVAAYTCLRQGIFFTDPPAQAPKSPREINAGCDVLEKALDLAQKNENELRVDFPLIDSLLQETRGVVQSWRVPEAGRE